MEVRDLIIFVSIMFLDTLNTPNLELVEGLDIQG